MKRLVASLIFSRRFLGDFLEAAAVIDPDQASYLGRRRRIPMHQEVAHRRVLGTRDGRWPRFSPCRPLIVNSQGAKRKMLVGRPATTAATDQGSERRARPQ